MHFQLKKILMVDYSGNQNLDTLVQTLMYMQVTKVFQLAMMKIQCLSVLFQTFYCFFGYGVLLV